MKYSYASIKEDDEYILVDVKVSLGMAVMCQDISYEIKSKMGKIYSSLFEFEKENKCGYVSNVLLRKNSEVGQYITSHSDMFLDDSKYISYEKIVNAFNVAVYEDNAKMSNKIMPLFKGMVSGDKKELLEQEQAKENVLDYILINDNFYEYLEKQNGEQVIKNYLVYDDKNDDYFYVRYIDGEKSIENNNNKSFQKVLSKNIF